MEVLNERQRRGEGGRQEEEDGHSMIERISEKGSRMESEETE